MSAHDPLRSVELLAMLEEATTPLRHDVRNRIASVRNLAFFVRRKLSTEVAPERDPRVNEFLSKIEGEVQRTDDVIDVWSTRSQAARAPEIARVPVAECLRLAFACARLSQATGLELAPPAEPFEVDADREALAFAVRCLIENAGEAMGPGVVRVAADTADRLVLHVVGKRAEFVVEPHTAVESVVVAIGRRGSFDPAALTASFEGCV